MSGQDESNPALGLVTRAGRMELACLLGTTLRAFLQKITPKGI